MTNLPSAHYIYLVLACLVYREREREEMGQRGGRDRERERDIERERERKIEGRKRSEERVSGGGPEGGLHFLYT